MSAWSWETVREGALVALNTPMKKLENALRMSAKTMPVHARVATTDATPTTIRTFPVPVNHTVLITGYVVARRTGGSGGSANDGAAYRIEVVAKNTAGTAAEIAAETLTVVGESQAGWTVAASASSGNIIVQVTGAANNNVSWRWSERTFAVKDEE
jgi:hypothetical protein